MTAIRTIQPEDVNWVDYSSNDSAHAKATIYTPGCQGPFIANEKGQDSLACARCHNLRLLNYASKVAFLDNTRDIALLSKIIENFPFVEFAESKCGLYTDDPNVRQSPVIAYPLRSCRADPSLCEGRLKQVFKLWQQLKIANKEILTSQVFNRPGHHPVVLPNSETIQYEQYGGDEGVEFKPPSSPTSTKPRRFKVVDMDKVFASGRHAYAVNFLQVAYLVGAVDYPRDKDRNILYNKLWDNVKVF